MRALYTLERLKKYACRCLRKFLGLRFNLDFFVGYSPERINPGDKQHTLRDIVKVTSGSTEETARFVNALYGSVVSAGTYLAASIKTAEAAKAIENVQRDVNIALMNDLAMLFDKLGLDSTEVIDASATKWNFFPSGQVWSAATALESIHII